MNALRRLVKFMLLRNGIPEQNCAGGHQFSDASVDDLAEFLSREFWTVNRVRKRFSIQVRREVRVSIAYYCPFNGHSATTSRLHCIANHRNAGALTVD